MVMDGLSSDDLVLLVQRVFSLRKSDRKLCLLVDLPDKRTPDKPVWKERRALISDWFEKLRQRQAELELEVQLVFYRNAGLNNADLPEKMFVYQAGDYPDITGELPDEQGLSEFEQCFKTSDIIIAATQFSATAPLKLAAREYGFRAATMPGFNAKMMAALRLDYTEINRRVQILKALLDDATGADFVFKVGGREHTLHLDLRHRSSHASGGLFPDDGVAGNLPSGETYIVPYEGELDGDPSLSEGELPVQFGDEVVIYEVRQNRAVWTKGDGGKARIETERLLQEPAYGNMAELGLGVLSDFGLEPIGEILLDEKLGLHIAFGRSDHFGGQVGTKDFTAPDAVIHIDRVYLPSLMPDVLVKRADLVASDGQKIPLVEDGAYVVDFQPE